ncbi:MAG: hypothetical protein ACR2PF_20510 [Rhizobiaceae bacterium]
MSHRLFGSILTLLAVGTMIVSAASAADYLPASKICIPLQPAAILNVDDNATLSSTVVDMMNESVSVSEDESVIFSRRAAYTWASEAKVACGIAYGYLRVEHRDEQHLNKCECFFRRMQHYLN